MSFPIPFHDALAFPILCLSHHIRYLLPQTTDLPKTIDLLHQTTDDGNASTIPTITSVISFLRPPIYLRPSISPISTLLSFHSSLEQKRSPICLGHIQPMAHQLCRSAMQPTQPVETGPKVLSYKPIIYIYIYIYKSFTMLFFFHGCSISRFIAIAFLFILFLHSNQS